MSVRNQNIVMGVLTGIALLALIALFLFAARDNLIRYTLNPSDTFANTPQAAAPDYATDYAWSSRDGSASQRADVFFIYPTIYYSGEHWNAPISNEAVRERLANIIRPLYAQPFAQSANLFMPLYRQAAPYSFMGGSESGRQARQVAYSDIKRAFDAYLEQSAPDRPLIIAGYGQGGLLGMKLLADMEPATRTRLVAAYLLEVAIPSATMSTMVKGIPLCDSPDQVACAIIWHSTTPHARGDLARENALIWSPSGGFEPTRGRELVCVNPLTWSISGRAGSADENLGAGRLSDFGSGQVEITRGLTAADCWNGLLFTDVVPEPIFYWSGPRYRDLFPSTVNPFYADIEDNAQRRVASFWAQRAMATPENIDDPLPSGAPTLPPPDTSGVLGPEAKALTAPQ